MVSVGETAPQFELRDHNGDKVSLTDFRGQYVVLYFYPEAATRGCTVEARSFRAAWSAFEERDIPVLGVSLDPVEDLAAFRDDEELPFTLLSDPDGEVAKAYNVYDSGVHEGTPYELAQRYTFIIDPDGDIDAVYADVDPEGHARDVLDSLPAA